MNAQHTPGRAASQFLDAVRGIPANHVAQALNTFTPGILWTGCSKARMAERWVEAETATHRDDRALIAAPLDLVRARALARSQGREYWRDARPEDEHAYAEAQATKAVLNVLRVAVNRIRDSDYRATGLKPHEIDAAKVWLADAIAKATGSAS